MTGVNPFTVIVVKQKRKDRLISPPNSFQNRKRTLEGAIVNVLGVWRGELRGSPLVNKMSKQFYVSIRSMYH